MKATNRALKTSQHETNLKHEKVSCKAINYPFNKTLLVFAEYFAAYAHHKKRTSVQFHTNNGCLKLVEALPQIHSLFFSHSKKLRGLPVAAIIDHYLDASGLPAKMSAFNSHKR